MLVTLHFRLRPEEPITVMLRDGENERVTFYFEEQTIHDVFGEINARDVLGIYEGDEATRERSNPMLVETIDHMRVKDQNRNLLLDIVKPKSAGGRGLVRPWVSTRVGGYECLLPAGASEDLKRRVENMISKVGA